MKEEQMRFLTVKMQNEIKDIQSAWLTTNQGRRSDALTIALPLLIHANSGQDVLAIFKILNNTEFMHKSSTENTHRNRKHIIEEGKIVMSTGLKAGSTSSVMHFITQFCIALMKSFNVTNVHEKAVILKEPLNNLREKLNKDYSVLHVESLDKIAEKNGLQLGSRLSDDKASPRARQGSFFSDPDHSKKQSLVVAFNQYIIKECDSRIHDAKNLGQVHHALKEELGRSSRLSQKGYELDNLFNQIKGLSDQVASMPYPKACQEISELKKYFNTIVADILITEYGCSS